MIDAEPDLFIFSPEKGVVLLDETKKDDYFKGILCSDIGEANLTFNLTSDLLGNSTETISIPIERPKKVALFNEGDTSATENIEN